MQQQPTQEQPGNSYTAAEQREQESNLASLAVDVGVDVTRMLMEESSMVPTVREGAILFRFVDALAEAA